MQTPNATRVAILLKFITINLREFNQIRFLSGSKGIGADDFTATHCGQILVHNSVDKAFDCPHTAIAHHEIHDTRVKARKCAVTAVCSNIFCA